MDTSVLEYTAEDLVAHRLSRAGLLVAKPRFDQNGADLLALMQVNDMALFCRIQCKGRTLRQGKVAPVVVPCAYVTPGFIVFLFIETGDPTATQLFCFFEIDIKQRWRKRKRGRVDNFVLNLSAENALGTLAEFTADEFRVQLIKKILPDTDARQELRKLIFGTIAAQEPHADFFSSGFTGVVGPPSCET